MSSWSNEAQLRRRALQQYRRRGHGSAVLVLWLTLGTAHGEDDFKGHYDRGLQLYQERSFDAALREFLTAYDRRQFPRLLYNIARTYHRLGKMKEAVLYYEGFLRADPAMDVVTRAEVEKNLGQARSLLLLAPAAASTPPLPPPVTREPPPASAPAPSAAPPPLAEPPPAAAPAPAASASPGLDAAPARSVALLPTGAALRGRDTAAAPPLYPTRQALPPWRRWWFWTAIATAAAGGAAAGIAVALTRGGPPDNVYVFRPNL